MIKMVVRALREYAGDRSALSFGPLALNDVRKGLLGKALAVTTVTDRISRPLRNPPLRASLALTRRV